MALKNGDRIKLAGVWFTYRTDLITGGRYLLTDKTLTGEQLVLIQMEWKAIYEWEGRPR